MQQTRRSPGLGVIAGDGGKLSAIRVAYAPMKTLPAMLDARGARRVAKWALSDDAQKLGRRRDQEGLPDPFGDDPFGDEFKAPTTPASTESTPRRGTQRPARTVSERSDSDPFAFLDQEPQHNRTA